MDLSAVQLEANRKQWASIAAKNAKPKDAIQWEVGDSLEIHRKFFGQHFDMIFTCPPYGDLECYSEDPRDISGMGYEKFLVVLQDIMDRSQEMLEYNSFIAMVVGNFRDKSGAMRDFSGDVIRLMRRVGASLYNEAILVTAVGTLALRVRGMFEASRKLGRTHQNVLIFCKGDPKAATAKLGKADRLDLHEEDGK